MAKNFKSPAMDFISTSPQKAIEDNVPMKVNLMMIETKSKRLQLLMQPSLHAKIKKISAEKKTSVNDLIHQILDQHFLD